MNKGRAIPNGTAGSSSAEASVQSLFPAAGSCVRERALGGKHGMPAAGKTSAVRFPVYFSLAESSGLSRKRAAAGRVGSGLGQQCLGESRSSWSYSRGKHLTAVASRPRAAGKGREGKVLPGRRGEKAGLAPSGCH